MENSQTQERPEDDLDPTEMRIWIEFGAWCAFVMAPIIWWLQGPSVSTDQFVVRTSLVVISFVVGVGMRIWAIVQPYPPAETPTVETPNTTTSTPSPEKT